MKLETGMQKRNRMKAQKRGVENIKKQERVGNIYIYIYIYIYKKFL